MNLNDFDSDYVNLPLVKHFKDKEKVYFKMTIILIFQSMDNTL